MKNALVSMALLSLSLPALAHPGHGKPGWVHEHNFVDTVVVLLGVLVLALVGWALTLIADGRRGRSRQ